MAQFFTRVSFGSDEEAAAYNRAAWKLIPFLLILYIISFLDRVNVGFAKLQMSADIGLSDAVFGLGAGIFFIGYAACEIPSNLLLQRFGARFWISRILVVWGIISVCFMFVTTPAQFLTLRFLLGIAEAGFYPGIVLYLTYWFPGKLRSQVCALFFVGIPIAGFVGGPLSGFIMKTMAGVSGFPAGSGCSCSKARPRSSAASSPSSISPTGRRMRSGWHRAIATSSCRR